MGRKAVAWRELPDLLRAAEEAMASRGKAGLGEKTVINAAHAFRSSVQGLDDPQKILDTGIKVVHEAIEYFSGRPIKAGRARIGWEKSIGPDDPGMTAFKGMLDSSEAEAPEEAITSDSPLFR
jgi:hypothetical protein